MFSFHCRSHIPASRRSLTCLVYLVVHLSHLGSNRECIEASLLCSKDYAGSRGDVHHSMQLQSTTSIHRSNDCSSHRQACWSFLQDHLQVHVVLQKAMIRVLECPVLYLISDTRQCGTKERINELLEGNVRLVDDA